MHMKRYTNRYYIHVDSIGFIREVLKMSNELVKKTGIYAVGNFASKVANALLIPVYGWFVAAESLGYFDYYLTLMTMLAPLCFMALWEALLRFTIGKTDEKHLSKSVSTVFVMALCAVIIIIIVAIIMCCIFFDIAISIVSVALMTIFYGLAQIWQFFSRSFGCSRQYALSGIVAALLNFSCVLVLVCILGTQLQGLVISYVLSQASILVYLELKLKIIKKFKINNFDSNIAKQYLKFSIPMALNLLLGAFLIGFGRLLVVNYIGVEANGLYAFAMKFGSLITALGNIFSMAVIEEAVLRIGKPGHECFMDLVINNLLLILLSLASIALPAIRLLWPLLAGQEYVYSLAMVPAFIAFGVLSVGATVVGTIFNVVNKTFLNTLSMFAGCAVCTICSFVLIGQFGEKSVAWSTALGALMLFVFRYLIGKRYESYKINPVSTLFLGIAYAISVALFLFDWENIGLAYCFLWVFASILLLAPVTIRGVRGISRIENV